MNYKFIIVTILSFFLLSCDQSLNKKSKKLEINFENKYSNSGFALIYSDNLKGIKKLENRSLSIYHKSLKRKSMVKITNLINDKYLIAVVKSNKIGFSDFYNSILSLRIAEELELDVNEPFVEIKLVSENSTFVAKKAKMFDEEKKVAEKAPVDGIEINDLNVKKKQKKSVNLKPFSYSIKVADFYYKDTAELMMDRIKNEVQINDLIINKLSQTKYRVLIGPFNDIKSLKNSFEKMNYFNFENLEIIEDV